MSRPPALLLMHGVGDAGACWAPFVGQLRARPRMAGLRVVTPDAPAHGGRTAEPGHTIAWTDQLAEAVEIAEALVAETGTPIVSAGHSMGSLTALGLSATRPDLVAATFLEDPPFFAALPPVDAPAGTGQDLADLSELRAWFGQLQSEPLEQVIAAARADHPTWDPSEYEPWARAKQAVDLAAFRTDVDWGHSDNARIIRAAPAPVVVAAGRAELGSLVAPAAEADLVRLPGWQVTRLPTGHDVRRDAPDATVALLADLIDSVSS
ncbi:MAG: alpha/beta hydrolase [Actinomycetota bacterium]|nr:alpha/beta hydrolase [Actinomycetota bacterium]